MTMPDPLVVPGAPGVPGAETPGQPAAVPLDLCWEARPPHEKKFHRNLPTLAHNPWSEACSRRGEGEPYCVHALCSTCNVLPAGRPVAHTEKGERR